MTQFILALVLFAGSLASAQDLVEVKGYQYACGNADAAFALKYVGGEEVWLTKIYENGDVDKTGYALENVKYTIFRCPHCVSFTGDLPLAKWHFKGDMRSVAGKNPVLRVELVEAGQAVQKMELPCFIK